MPAEVSMTSYTDYLLLNANATILVIIRNYSVAAYGNVKCDTNGDGSTQITIYTSYSGTTPLAISLKCIILSNML